MAGKLSKKDLKSPDAFQTTFEKVGDYVSDHKTRVMVIAAALASAAVIVMGIYFYWNHYTTSALQLYAKAQHNIIKSGDDEQKAMSDNIDVYKQLLEKYPYSWSGRMAYYHLGNIYYNQGDIGKAIKSYEKFISKSGSDKTGITFLALTSLGYAYESKREYDEALKYFEQAQNSFNVGFEAIGFRNLARIYESIDNKEKALENYKKALEKTTETSAVIFLKRKISSLS